MKRKLLLTLTVLMFISLICFGQSGTSGTIKGTVKSADGEVLPGILVTLTSPAIVVKQLTTVTNENGVYRFMGLIPGTYAAKFELEGMGTSIRKGIKVSIGMTSTVNSAMSLKKILEEIVVVGKSPTIDRQNPTRTATLDIEFLKMIPSQRTMGNYLNMAPGITGDTASGGSVRDNSYNLDGVNLNDPSVGTDYVSFGADIMEEISITQGAVTAEYGAVRGAVVNVVSKSGGNKFHGQAIMFYRGNSMQSTNTDGTPLEGRESGFDYEMEPGFSLGGPVIKDKLWFFANMNYNKSSVFFAGFPWDSDTDTPRLETNPYPFVKLTFQPKQSDKFVVSYNYSGRSYDYRANSGAMSHNNLDSTWHQETKTNTVSAHWSHNWSDNFVTNVKFGMFKSDFNLLVNVEKPLYLNLWTDGNYYNGGGNDDMYKRNRMQFNIDGTTFVDNFMGSHELKFGVALTLADSGRANHSYGEATNMFGEAWQGGFFDLYRQHPAVGTVYRDSRGEYSNTNNLQNLSLFIQDTWLLTNRLTLNLGIRFENQKGIIPAQNQDMVPYTVVDHYNYYDDMYVDQRVLESQTVLDWKTISPRVSMIYDIFGDGTTLFKASYGRYYAANMTQYFSPANRNQGVFLRYKYDELWAVTIPGSFKIGWTNPDTGKEYPLRNPYLDEVTIGLERELWEDWSVGIRYIQKWDRDLPDDADANGLDMAKLMEDGELDWWNYDSGHSVTDPYDGSTQTWYDTITRLPGEFYMVNGPDLFRNFTGFEVTLNKRFSKGWSINASYVYQKSTGVVGTDFADSYGFTSYYDSPNFHTNKNGRMPLERRHQFKLQTVIKGPWGINFGSYFRMLSGNRYTRVVNAEDLGLDLAEGGNILAEQKGTRGLPNLVTLDVKLEKGFKFSNITVSVFADIFNVFNQGVATAVETMSSTPGITFEEMTSITQPRIIRIGAKIEF